LKHLGRGQKIINDAKEVREREEKAAAAQTVSDVSDPEAKVEQEISFYDIIVDEFEPVGAMQDHVVALMKEKLSKRKNGVSVCFVLLSFICLFIAKLI
jgi:hypothetical protein